MNKRKRIIHTVRPLRRDGQEFRHGRKGLILVGEMDPCFIDSDLPPEEQTVSLFVNDKVGEGKCEIVIFLIKPTSIF